MSAFLTGVNLIKTLDLQHDRYLTQKDRDFTLSKLNHNATLSKLAVDERVELAKQANPWTFMGPLLNCIVIGSAIFIGIIFMGLIYLKTVCIRVKSKRKIELMKLNLDKEQGPEIDPLAGIKLQIQLQQMLQQAPQPTQFIQPPFRQMPRSQPIFPTVDTVNSGRVASATVETPIY